MNKKRLQALPFDRLSSSQGGLLGDPSTELRTGKATAHMIIDQCYVRAAKAVIPDQIGSTAFFLNNFS